MSVDIELISTRRCGKKHISFNTILGMEDEFVDEGCSLKELNMCIYFVNKILKKTFKKTLSDFAMISSTKNNKYKMFISMDYGDFEIHKSTLKRISDKLILYIFDCWEPQWDRYEIIFREINPVLICFAYEKSANHFRENCGFRTLHVPQSMNAKLFTPGIETKTRLFMQMGRRTSTLHSMCLNYIAKNNLDNCDANYVYEREKGKVIFPSNDDLVAEMRKTYFFMVAPQCVDNYEHTGNISEVTARFYEAMATKTLCVGIKPQDNFDKLFPYENAMIEVNEDNFDETVKWLLTDNVKYKEIVDANYEYVMNNHRWKNRLELIISSL